MLGARGREESCQPTSLRTSALGGSANTMAAAVQAILLARGGCNASRRAGVCACACFPVPWSEASRSRGVPTRARESRAVEHTPVPPWAPGTAPGTGTTTARGATATETAPGTGMTGRAAGGRLRGCAAAWRACFGLCVAGRALRAARQRWRMAVRGVPHAGRACARARAPSSCCLRLVARPAAWLHGGLAAASGQPGAPHTRAPCSPSATGAAPAAAPAPSRPGRARRGAGASRCSTWGLRGGLRP